MTEPDRDSASATRIIRPVDRGPGGRIVFGVCAGLGTRTGIDPIVFRVATVIIMVATFGGGTLIYLAGWALTADERSTRSWLEQRLGRRFDAGTVLLLLTALLVVALVLAAFSGGRPDGALVIFVVLGIGLLVAHSRGVDLRAEAGSLPYRLRHSAAAGIDEPVDLASYGAAPGPTPPPVTSAGAPMDPAGPPTGYRPGGDAAPWEPAGYRPEDDAAPWDPNGPVDLARLGAAGGHPAGPTDSAAATVPPGGVDMRTLSDHRPERYHRPTFLFPATFLLAAGAGAAAATVPTQLHGWPTGATALRAAQYGLAAALTVIGIGVVVGAWYGRTRSLISLGVLVAVLFAAVTWGKANGFDRGTVGHVTWRPTTAAAASEPFRSRFGDARLDLTGLSLHDGRHLTVHATSRAGTLNVTVPDDVRVNVDAHTSFGDIQVDGHTSSGRNVRVHRTLTPLSHANHPAVIDLELRGWFGDMEVTR